MRSFSRLCSVGAFLALAAFDARAQCTPIPATGCPRQLAPTCRTSPQIGTTFTWVSAPCLTTVPALLIFGTVLNPPLPVSPPIVCGNAPCDLGCQPLVVAQAASMSIPIPPLRILIGATFCIQSACISQPGPCFNLSQASSVTIM
jgi:hypothetical protein